jgi:hypothetical protein
MADILILTTGGTIDKVYFDALSEFQVGDTMVTRLMEIGLVKQDVRVQEIAARTVWSWMTPTAPRSAMLSRPPRKAASSSPMARTR